MTQGPYSVKIGFVTQGNGVDIGFVTQGPYAVKVGFRFHLMLHDKEYKLFRMLEKGISFVSDMSSMPRGIISAIYFFGTQDPYSVNVGSCCTSWRKTTSTSFPACSRMRFHLTMT